MTANIAVAVCPTTQARSDFMAIKCGLKALLRPEDSVAGSRTGRADVI
jgi:hypothetical protein